MAFAETLRSATIACSITLLVGCLPSGAMAAGELPAPAASSSQPEVLTLDEAARFLRVEPQALADLAKSSSVPARSVQGQWRFLRAALADWLRGDRFVAAATPPQAARAAASAPQAVGEKPNARTAEETALRDQGVLMPAGRTSVEAGLSYSRSERQNFGLLRVVQNTTTASFTARYGLRDDLQVSARLPATYRRISTDVVPALGNSTSTSDTYAGDLSSSVLGVLAREGVGRPNVVVSGDVVVPTGPGDRGVGAGIVLSKSFDPVVLFGGANYMRGFQVDGVDPRRTLGENNVGFNFGYVYALNDSVALSGTFIGSYKTYPRSFGTSTLTPSRESYQLQLGATMQVGRGVFVEPAIGIGIGGASPDVTLSVNVPFAF
ncbi:helix-turn-helix domain-containing protein [Ramlibacter sp. G-1-2-2]|uniref:Helix-turn-helix domain-containing protein n=1 Tax=Ramlibacter agri TaxID=2728837 RepID=A0A848HA20_9BURK|nr:helix-turn-helix domain-containing protein [Ramlibacter agri]NML44458.1 helix-turn-helix domain-containing protein [Ramlibacter agri]